MGRTVESPQGIHDFTIVLPELRDIRPGLTQSNVAHRCLRAPIVWHHYLSLRHALEIQETLSARMDHRLRVTDTKVCMFKTDGHCGPPMRPDSCSG
jgi:hypothetical protein